MREIAFMAAGDFMHQGAIHDTRLCSCTVHCPSSCAPDESDIRNARTVASLPRVDALLGV